MTNTITRLQALITQAEAQTDKLPIVALHDEDIQALRDAVRAMEWQPIETAPKDGTHILCCTRNDGKGMQFETWFIDETATPFWFDCGIGIEPTHWMPLPQPPKEA